MTNRRDFLKSAAVTGAAALVSDGEALASQQAGRGGSSDPPAQATAPVAPREVDPPEGGEVITTDRPGGDFMVDVLKTLDFEFIASNPSPSSDAS